MKTKKLILSISVFFIVLTVWAMIIFYNINYKDSDETKNQKNIKIEEITKYEPAKNYNINKTSNSKLIENKNIGLDITIPKDWNAEIDEFKDISEIKITTPDFKSGINFPEKGCEIRVGAVYFLKKEKTKPQIIKDKLLNKDLLSDSEETVIVSEQSALKTIQYENPETGQIIAVEKPFSNKNALYFFNIHFLESEKLKCLNYFDNFLNLISIKQTSF